MAKNTETSKKKFGILLQLVYCGQSNLILTATTKDLHPSELLPTLVSEVVFMHCIRANNCLDGRVKHH